MSTQVRNRVYGQVYDQVDAQVRDQVWARDEELSV